MKNGKQYLTDGMELPKQDKIRTLGEKEIFKYLGILEADTLKKWRWKKKFRKNIPGEVESYSGLNYQAETLSKE